VAIYLIEISDCEPHTGCETHLIKAVKEPTFDQIIETLSDESYVIHEGRAGLTIKITEKPVIRIRSLKHESQE
jgi:Mn-dependent DtxR family transcriptional regulator